jgi:hypothetical protein
MMRWKWMSVFPSTPVRWKPKDVVDVAVPRVSAVRESLDQASEKVNKFSAMKYRGVR